MTRPGRKPKGCGTYGGYQRHITLDAVRDWATNAIAYLIDYDLRGQIEAS